jgi:hypothetical protein
MVGAQIASGPLQEFLGFVADGAGADAEPDEDEDNRAGEDEGGDGVDFGSDAAAEASEDFEGERVVASD